jgi:hypothetical protein
MQAIERKNAKQPMQRRWVLKADRLKPAFSGLIYHRICNNGRNGTGGECVLSEISEGLAVLPFGIGGQSCSSWLRTSGFIFKSLEHYPLVGVYLAARPLSIIIGLDYHSTTLCLVEFREISRYALSMLSLCRVMRKGSRSLYCRSHSI